MRALTAVARFGRTELAPPLLRALPVPAELAPVLSPILRALRRLGLQSEIADLLARFETMPHVATLELELTVAGARAALDAERASPTFELAVKRLGAAEMLTPTARLALVRTFAAATTHAPVAFGLAQLRLLRPLYGQITDSYGTNSHYCLSALHFVESLVLAITDMKLAALDPHDPADAPFLAWKYALP